MPTYLYTCLKTNQEFEEYHSITTKLEDCPICKEKGLEPHIPKRLICGSSKGVVVLTGHELTAKNKENVINLKKEIYNNEKLYANVVGETKYNQMQKNIDKYK